MKDFFKELQTQRWDDHRYYHHCRINQSLHLLSAMSFVVAYGMLFIDPPVAALIAWMVSMTSRQSGHFFFEPLGYDHVNQATNDHKEEIKVGYNLRRKAVLLSVWALLPLAIYLKPGLMGWLPAHDDFSGFLHAVGYAWLYLGVAALLFRTVHLFFIKDVQTGLVWMTKILTDPFHDIYLYHKAPLQLLKGQRFEHAEMRNSL
ncbi:MAG: hypothetical protein CFE39_01920 [Comamonadaceae bacterium PBBC2]|nr:MAG: hypothetical protein CFE39_01920 [Comamonadaceae bacterium PBBC2]